VEKRKPVVLNNPSATLMVPHKFILWDVEGAMNMLSMQQKVGTTITLTGKIIKKTVETPPRILKDKFSQKRIGQGPGRDTRHEDRRNCRSTTSTGYS